MSEFAHCPVYSITTRIVNNQPETLFSVKSFENPQYQQPPVPQFQEKSNNFLASPADAKLGRRASSNNIAPLSAPLQQHDLQRTLSDPLISQGAPLHSHPDRRPSITKIILENKCDPAVKVVLQEEEKPQQPQRIVIRQA